MRQYGIYLVDEGTGIARTGYVRQCVESTGGKHNIWKDDRLLKEIKISLVITWSLGNEAATESILRMYDWAKSAMSRPVQYEQAIRDRNTHQLATCTLLGEFEAGCC